VEQHWVESARLSIPKVLSSRTAGGTALHWRQRIARSVRYPDAAATERYASTVVGPALREVADELTAAGREATVGEQLVESCGIHAYHLDVLYEGERGFHYQVYPTEHLIPQYGRLPKSPSKFFRLEVFTASGSSGFDVFGFSKDQLISNVLDHYERHLEFLHRSVGGDSTTVDVAPVLDWSTDFESIPADVVEDTDGTAGTTPNTKEES